VCACSYDFTCARCAGTPFDPRYFDSEPEAVSEEAFENLMLDRPPIIMLGEE
jgi:hypothetical protein